MRWLGVAVWTGLAAAILALSGFACGGGGGGDDDSGDPSATISGERTGGPSVSATPDSAATSSGFGSPSGSASMPPSGSATVTPSATNPASPTATTPGSTSTTVPASTPTSASENSPEGLRIRNDSSFIDSDGDLQLVGEVVNNTGASVAFVELTARFYGSGGALLAEESGYGLAAVMPDGTDAPFEVILIEPPAGIARYEVEVVGFEEPAPDSDAPVGLVTAETGRTVDGDGFLIIDGTVSNTSGDDYEFVEVVGAFYGPDGRVLRTGVGFIEAEVLEAGGSAPFSMLAWDGEPVRGAPLRMWVNGYNRPEP